MLTVRALTRIRLRISGVQRLPDSCIDWRQLNVLDHLRVFATTKTNGQRLVQGKLSAQPPTSCLALHPRTARATIQHYPSALLAKFACCDSMSTRTNHSFLIGVTSLLDFIINKVSGHFSTCLWAHNNLFEYYELKIYQGQW